MAGRDGVGFTRGDGLLFSAGQSDGHLPAARGSQFLYIFVCAYIHEVTKTITIADDVYDSLKSLKEPGESFSDVARRLTEEVKRRRLLSAGGAWRDLPIDAERLKREIRAHRDETGEPRTTR